MVHFSSLKLLNFRCYDAAKLPEISGGFVVLYGPNGAGKTNVLEALSLFSPGRGLRGVKPLEMQNNSAPNAWGVAAELSTTYGPVALGTGIDPKAEKRVIRINGENAKSQAMLLEHLSLVWLTPQMDRLFIDSASHRRKFLDRLIYAFDPAHSGRVTRYENAMRQRSKLLKDGNNEDVWLTGLEAQMAETGVAIAAARLHFVEDLSAACQVQDSPSFPRSLLSVSGTVEELLGAAPAVEVEAMFAYQLKQSRAQDAVSGGAATGPHKSDLLVTYAAKNMAAEHCSTGEQKALLIGIILAHSRLIKEARGAAPILLLDEVAAHLDEDRRAALYDVLESFGAQVWLTGTDRNLFAALEGRGQFFEIRDAEIKMGNTAKP